MDECDVAVIGSGFGGAITACRLAESNRQVRILERGKRWSNVEFPRRPRDISSAIWSVRRRNYGFLDYRFFETIEVIQGCGVGGGSLHYFNVHLRAPAEVFDSDRWPASITRDALDPYYDKVERAVRENWIPPQDMNFEVETAMTVVSLTLLPDGRVLKSYIEETSGDPQFDESVMRAILKSTPFPPPPIGLKQQRFDLGLRFHSTP